MTDPIKIIRKEDYLSEYDKPNQEEVWDKIAKPWKKYVVKKIPAVEDFLEGKKGKVIDIGCGTGRNMIPSSDLEYVGVEFSAGQIEKAKGYIGENNVRAELIKTSASDLSMLKDRSFDFGLFVASLHCIEGEENRKNALKEFYRVLKKGSEALITVWDSTDKRFDHVGNNGEIYMTWREGNIPHMRYYYLYKKEELKDLLESVGFKVLSFRKRENNENARFHKKNLIIKIQKP